VEDGDTMAVEGNEQPI